MTKRLVFVSYTRLIPTTQIGVFKRCLRLFPHLRDDHEIHLVNLGPPPEKDALFLKLRDDFHLHEPCGDLLGDELSRLLEELAPAALVLGESPLRGSMRLAYRVARKMNIRQACIENYYGEFVDDVLPSEWPGVRHWILLGLLPDGVSEVAPGRLFVVPPFVKFPTSPRPRDRFVILGYDRHTLGMGGHLLRRLPADSMADVIVSPEWVPLLDSMGIDERKSGTRVLVLPDDEALYDSLAQARLVLGKAGYQQIVECLAMGTPIVCLLSGGGVDENLVAPYLKPWVRFVACPKDLDRVLLDVAGWLLQPADLPWTDLGRRLGDPISIAAESLRVFASEEPAVAGTGG